MFGMAGAERNFEVQYVLGVEHTCIILYMLCI